MDPINLVLVQHGFNHKVVRPTPSRLAFSTLQSPERIDHVLLHLSDLGFRYRSVTDRVFVLTEGIPCGSCGDDVVPQEEADVALVFSKMPDWIQEVGREWLPLCGRCFVRTLSDAIGTMTEPLG